MSIRKDDLLLIEHPMFNDRHVIARAVQDSTKSTVNVVYFSQREGWKDEVHRRTLRHVVGRLRQDDVQSVLNRIEEARSAMEAKIEAAKRVYNEAIDQELTKGEIQ